MKTLYDISTIEGKIAVMQRYIEDPAGLLIKRYVTSDWEKFHTRYDKKNSLPPSWNWVDFTYNYSAPEKKKVLKPWNFDNCPKGAVLVKPKGCETPFKLYIVTAWTTISVFLTHSEVNFESLCKDWEYSLDGDNWAPCGIEVEE